MQPSKPSAFYISKTITKRRNKTMNTSITSVQTTIVSSDNGMHTYEVKKVLLDETGAPAPGSDAILIGLYPTTTTAEPYKTDLSTSPWQRRYLNWPLPNHHRSGTLQDGPQHQPSGLQNAGNRPALRPHPQPLFPGL